jgi:hypothetical protein
MSKMFVSIDGEYGDAEDLITFNGDRLTERQWDIVGELSHFDRYKYIDAILNDDSEVIAEYEGEE